MALRASDEVAVSDERVTDGLTQFEREVDLMRKEAERLRERVAELTKALRGVLSFISVQEEAVGIAGHIYPTQVVGIALGPDVDALLLAARAALSAGETEGERRG
jgi:hypothetical protein